MNHIWQHQDCSTNTVACMHMDTVRDTYPLSGCFTIILKRRKNNELMKKFLGQNFWNILCRQTFCAGKHTYWLRNGTFLTWGSAAESTDSVCDGFVTKPVRLNFGVPCDCIKMLEFWIISSSDSVQGKLHLTSLQTASTARIKHHLWWTEDKLKTGF